jgi:hypothetical protein
MPYASRHNLSAAVNDRRTRHLYFVSGHRANITDDFVVSAINCSVAETHVEVAVSCPKGRDCKATRMRRSIADARPDYLTPLDWVGRMKALATDLPLDEIGNAGRSSATELFLHDSLKQLSEPPPHPYVDLSRVPPRLFAQRLLVVANSWYQLSLLNQLSAVHANQRADLAAYGFDFARLPANGSVPQALIAASCRIMCTRSTQARLTHTIEVFAYRPLWLALLFASAAALLVAGIAGRIVSWRTHAPDILGYAASMTYNNRFFSAGGQGSVTDAMDRVRIFFDQPVMVADVQSDEVVGHIAFTSNVGFPPLECGRKYT